jgi:hypothetical protein
MKACPHPKSQQQRDTIELSPGVTRVEDTCALCRHSRYYIRDDNQRTMTDWRGWSAPTGAPWVTRTT